MARRERSACTRPTRCDCARAGTSRCRAASIGRSSRTSTRITPGGGPGSLDGTHTFSRFNPAAGLTIDLPRRVNAYVGYSEGSRAATSIELGCADPESPCKLPNAMAGDPPLDQVVTRTIRAPGCAATQRRAMECRLLPRRQSRRHSVRDVRADRLRLLPQLRQHTAAGARGSVPTRSSAVSRLAPATRSSMPRFRVPRR